MVLEFIEIIAISAFVISEILPFLKTCNANGLCHLVYLFCFTDFEFKDGESEEKNDRGSSSSTRTAESRN